MGRESRWGVILGRRNRIGRALFIGGLLVSAVTVMGPSESGSAEDQQGTLNKDFVFSGSASNGRRYTVRVSTGACRYL